MDLLLLRANIIMTINTNKLIHVARKGSTLYFLRKKGDDFVWFEGENETPIVSKNIEEAIRLANRKWHFRMLACGFRYTLPERDEHGNNALFYQMAASQKTLTGVYFDEELGHPCIVQNASGEALDLLKTYG